MEKKALLIGPTFLGDNYLACTPPDIQDWANTLQIRGGRLYHQAGWAGWLNATVNLTENVTA